MLNISSAVAEILAVDVNAQEALERGLLNLSSYARLIKQEVEAATLKPVGEKSIVVSLSRLTKAQLQSPKPKLAPKLATISVHGNLQVLTLENILANSTMLEPVIAELLLRKQNEFFTFTTSINELTVIAENHLMTMIRRTPSLGKPIFFQKGLIGLTVKFQRRYLEIPNIIFEITKKLAIKQVNIIEIVSTATELTYILDKRDTDIALAQLGKLLG